MHVLPMPYLALLSVCSDLPLFVHLNHVCGRTMKSGMATQRVMLSALASVKLPINTLCPIT